jgi:hypothetical protein
MEQASAMELNNRRQSRFYIKKQVSYEEKEKEGINRYPQEINGMFTLI